MRAIILKEPGQFSFIEQEEVKAEKNKAIVKIKRIGICGTDYHAFKGDQPFFTYPRVLGHELGGEVVSISEGDIKHDLKIGDKVAVEPYLNCGKCQACESGHLNCCENIQVIGVHSDGGMAEYISIPLNKIHKSDTLSFDQLALVETLGIGLHAVNRAKLNQGEKVLIIGAGPIGLGVAQFSKLKGAQVCMADISGSRLAFIEKMGLSDSSIQVSGSLDDADLRAALGGDLPSVVIDATGNKNSMLNTFNIVAHGGRVVFVGLFQGDVTFFDPNFHKRELTLMSSRNCLPDDFREIISLIEKEVIDTNPWLSHRTSFEDMPNKFETFLEPSQEVIKAIIEL
ncbi:zinc-binding alcohol dehydrogenase family protein [Arcticibacterium luteifluviistationis]|uniref:Alcohol dehydrogenase n=1 Tax=Arcticibacterium luteifluviistationis TaxID=1784714 RepID=A0A2Z4GAT2_9BACT|nr:zinc-binding alcohol dehydrogenase family protein [Arcticibacterium luteifluviistationis]AWV98382.1 alcohol dehydrogenase [Arcticibacterium luteifluviistationis]